MKQQFYLIAAMLGISFLSMLCPSPLIAESPMAPSEMQPKICVGEYGGKWGRNSRETIVDGVAMCPPGHAIYGTSTVVGSPAESKYIHVRALCCPLPSTDILLQEHLFVEVECPDGFVVTGVSPRQECDTCVGRLRCTKIDQSRYELGPETNGSLFSVAPLDYPWKEETVRRFDEIPAGIRYGLPRLSQHAWEHSGCVGEPYGSLLVGKRNKRCKGIKFRQLFFAENAGTRKGMPVPMFPVCEKLSSKYSKDPQCINRE